MARLKNTQHELFALALAKGASVVDALERAGYARATGNGSRLMRRPEVKARVEELMAAAAERTQITVAEVLENMARIARADLREVFRPDGTLKPVSEWPTDAALAIASVETREISAKGKAVGVVQKVKLWDKTKALDLLGQHFGMLKQVVEVKGPLDTVSNEELERFIGELRSIVGQGNAGAAGSGEGEADGAKPAGDVSTLH